MTIQQLLMQIKGIENKLSTTAVPVVVDGEEVDVNLDLRGNYAELNVKGNMIVTGEWLKDITRSWHDAGVEEGIEEGLRQAREASIPADILEDGNGGLHVWTDTLPIGFLKSDKIRVLVMIDFDDDLEEGDDDLEEPEYYQHFDPDC